MSQEKLCFASDNWAPVHPDVLQAVLQANEGYAPAYGADLWSEEAQKLIQSAFKSKCKVFFVPNGTGANVFGLKISCKRHESVVCTDIAHIDYQESGAAESVVGCKLLTVPHRGGKIVPEEIKKKLQMERAFGRHSTFPRILSITQPTEVGTVYTLEELRSLSKLCKEEGLFLHMDGSRLYNAAVSLKISLDKLIEAAQPDVLSLGGTKNGLMSVEALLIFNPSLEEGSDYLHKQSLQLLSKMRYLSTQYIPFFKQDLWKALALQANQKAQEIAAIIKETPNLTLSYQVDSNQVFFTAPASWIPLIQEEIFCYLWDRERGEIRFIASWNTSDEEIKRLRSVFSKISKIFT